jgi:hypothetical protein
MNKKVKLIIVLVAIAMTGSVFVVANAQEKSVKKTVSASALASTSPAISSTTIATSTKATKAEAKKVTALIAKADKEIDRRITSLNKLVLRVGEMKKLNDQQKSDLSNQAQDQITELTSLKAKIDADTDLASLKSDIQSITGSYRTYMLLMPKINILATADRFSYIAEGYESVVDKLQNQISGLKDSGKDTASLQTSLDTIKAKVDDIKTQVQAAIDTVNPLAPDNGDKATIDANKAALAKAKATIKAANTDVKTIQSKIVEIRKGIKSLSK